MHVDIDSTGPVSEARRMLANMVVRDALDTVRAHVGSARYRILEADLEQRCTLEVRLTNGSMLECHGMASNMADAFECAAHGMRRKMFAALGLPLPTRKHDACDASAERRAI
jgi:hypothetical protein